jgi:bifunctional non-homologous end joining protein LigD
MTDSRICRKRAVSGTRVVSVLTGEPYTGRRWPGWIAAYPTGYCAIERTGCHDEAVSPDEARDGVALTHLDEPLFEGAGVTKRDLIDYLDAISDRLLPPLRDRPLSVIRVLRGQAPFMQKNVPKYTPDWVRTVQLWAQSSRREISYALCNDRRTLLWFGNQRAVEYHPSLFRIDRADEPTHLVLDIDPPEGDSFRLAVQAAHLVRQALAEAGLAGAVKTSGAKGIHVFVPVAGATTEEVAAATRALAARAERIDPALATTAFVREDRAGKVFLDATRAGGATVVAAYSPRLRPGVPVSFPVRWDDVDAVRPGDFPLTRVAGLLAGTDPWAALMPVPLQLSRELVEEGRLIPVARVQAMHEGKRRAQARRQAAPEAPDPEMRQ